MSKKMTMLRAVGLFASLALSVLAGCVNNPAMNPLSAPDDLHKLTGLNGPYTITLVDENGAPLANYPSGAEPRNLRYKYRCGGTWAPETSVQTDGNGQFTVNPDCSAYAPRKWDGKLRVFLNQTSKEQDIRSNTVFQAAKVNVNLKSCSGPITDDPGGTVAQGGGYWYTHGTTGPTGTVSFYAFPNNGNTVKVRMEYNHGSQTVNSFSVKPGVNNIDFVATELTLRSGGAIKSNTGGSWWFFQKPTMFLLPGPYNFWFEGSWYGPWTINVTGCKLEYALLRLVDENGQGVAGGKATPAVGGSWKSTLPGQTDANGNLFGQLPAGWTKIKMSKPNMSQEKSETDLEASGYTWTMEIVRIWLLDHAGNPITDGNATLEMGGGTWVSYGNLNNQGYLDVPLFPGGPYRFRMTYNYISQTLDGGTTPQGPVVTEGPGIQNYYGFQTGQVIGACITQYSAGTWRTFTSGMELMPGTYTFRYPSQSGTVVAGQVTNLSCP